MLVAALPANAASTRSTAAVIPVAISAAGSSPAVVAVPAVPAISAAGPSIRPAVAPASLVGAAVPPASAVGSNWTLAEAEAAVTAGAIARIAGAPAIADEASIRAAIGAAPIRVLMLPFVPVDDSRTSVEQRAAQLQDWAQTQGWGLIVVQGLQVLVSAYDVQPGTVADLEPVLAAADVTHQVLRAITVLHQEAVTTSGAATASTGAAGGQTATDRGQTATAGAAATTGEGAATVDGVGLPAETTADPGQVTAIGDALSAHRIYSDPTLPTEQTVTADWSNVGPGLTLRAAFLPAVAAGTALTDLITPLSQRFPHDVVVVVRGRWIEVAGPDPELLDSALLWLYGNYRKPFLRWDIEPTQFVGLLAGQIGLLRTGVVSDQASPAAPTDPVSSAPAWLPWLFVGTALLLAGAAGWWTGRSRRNRRMAAEAATRSEILLRRRFGARLAGVAGQIVDLDGLAEDGTARVEVDAAVERYRVARDVLTDDGDMTVATGALDAAERHLVSAGRLLRVPLSGEPSDEPADPAP